MKLTERHTQVLIVGAGPSGLMMAAQLLRYGIQPVVIDNKKGPTNHTRALAVQARTLEIYRQMGIADEVLKEGKPAEGLNFYYEGKRKGIFPVKDIGEEQTPYPYVFIYPQSKNERTLINYLTQHAVAIYWDTTLQQLSQNNTLAEALLISEGAEVKITADWVIGADGAHSTVRKQLGIAFKGDTYPSLFYLADVIADQQDDFIDLHLSDKGFAGFFPTAEPGGFRIIGAVPEKLQDKELTLDDVLPEISQVTKTTFRVKECRWFTTYKLHHRMAEEFRSGRSFLIGDAAHIHSPVGGQGMNTGLQDAYNLAWKLAGVINRKLEEKILQTYAAERMPVARELLQTTDRAFKLLMSKSPMMQLGKKWLLPKVISWLWGNDGIRKNFFKRLSQTGISYRHSPISIDLSHSSRYKAGDRLPYLKLYDEKKQEETDLQAWCSKPGFTLILMGQMAEQDLLNYARWITHFYGSGLNFFYLPLTKRNWPVFYQLEVKQNHNKTIIVRPDGHIGFMCDSADIDVINNYLQFTAGLIRADK
ncbi:FAD-dependent monooxygenase [Mucilaginibacter sp. RS28]|uniref:FAD-dependent monooxygenase n=1 Tax=Mucilaginibacter straminoryzae TaxID=2932774 RepID=A0A9X1WZF2_9SPHI|nr:FAD-dependent monooxygenase [Mucilaginibacter straminoryzae]MCJ8208462.1 FAD-dependent monooxygenase [Mucilaginibacter straminoryzae]